MRQKEIYVAFIGCTCLFLSQIHRHLVGTFCFWYNDVNSCHGGSLIPQWGVIRMENTLRARKCKKNHKPISYPQTTWLCQLLYPSANDRFYDFRLPYLVASFLTSRKPLITIQARQRDYRRVIEYQW